MFAVNNSMPNQKQRHDEKNRDCEKKLQRFQIQIMLLAQLLNFQFAQTKTW